MRSPLVSLPINSAEASKKSTLLSAIASAAVVASMSPAVADVSADKDEGEQSMSIPPEAPSVKQLETPSTETAETGEAAETAAGAPTFPSIDLSEVCYHTGVNVKSLHSILSTNIDALDVTQTIVPYEEVTELRKEIDGFRLNPEWLEKAKGVDVDDLLMPQKQTEQNSDESGDSKETTPKVDEAVKQEFEQYVTELAPKYQAFLEGMKQAKVTQLKTSVEKLSPAEQVDALASQFATWSTLSYMRQLYNSVLQQLDIIKTIVNPSKTPFVEEMEDMDDFTESTSAGAESGETNSDASNTTPVAAENAVVAA